MKLRISKKRIIILFALFFVIILGIIYYFISRPLYIINYHDTTIGFRVNLKEASGVRVYPDKNTLHSTITNPLIQNITIVFKDAGEKNGYYILEEIEIINKLTLLYKIIRTNQPEFNALEVQDYENLTTTKENLIIALIHPIYSEEKSVRVEDNVIYIQGRDLEEFDLATVKFLMVALDIKV
jgi:hypothetical protein